MADKRDVGELAAYGLFSVFTFFVFPVAGPFITWKNWNGYAEKLSWVPGISETGGAVSGVVTFFYVAIIISLVGSAAIGASGGVAAFTEVQASGPGTGSGPSGNQTATPAPIGTATNTSNDSSGSSSDLSEEEQRYLTFGETLSALASSNGVSVTSVSANASTDTLVLEFESENVDNTTTVRNEQRVLLDAYADAVAGLDSEDSSYNLTEIPSTVEIVTLDSTGLAHSRGEITFSDAYSLSSESIDEQEYERRFFTSVEEV